MKNTLLFLLVATTLFSSCSQEENHCPEPKTIIGTWNAISFIANKPLYDINGDGINSTELLDELSCRYSTLILNADSTFYQENNSWAYNANINTYVCTTDVDISTASGTWKVNSNFTFLFFEIEGNTTFLEIEFDGELLKFHSSEVFLNRNALGDLENIYGQVLFQRT